MSVFVKWAFGGLMALSLFIPEVSAQTPFDPTQTSKLEYDDTNQIYRFKWWGKTGRTYFLQTSEDLMTWTWLPIIEVGNDAEIEWGFTSNSTKCFVRLRYVNQMSTDPEEGDLDGDGISNLDELLNGDDPGNYYSQNGEIIVPLIEVESATVQTGLRGTFFEVPLVVRVRNSVGGAVLPFAPVKFTVDGGSQLLASMPETIATRYSAIERPTDLTGRISNALDEIYFLFPNTSSTVTTVQVSAGSAIPAQLTFTTNPPGAPSAISDLEASTNGSGHVHLEWEDNSDDETGFKIERSLDGGINWQNLTTVASNVTEYTDTTVPTGENATYQIFALNGQGSSYSVAISQDGTQLRSFTIRAVSERYEQNKVTWSGTQSGETVVLQRKGPSGGFANLSTFTDGTTSYIDESEDIKSHDRFTYRIKVSGPNGTSYSPAVIERDVQQYAIIELGDAGAPIRVTNKGVVLLGKKDSDPGVAGYRWKDGVLSTLVGDGEVADMNEDETVVGWGWSRSTSVYRYWGGGIPFPEVGYVAPTEINVFMTGTTWLAGSTAAQLEALTTFYNEQESFNYGEILHNLFGWEDGSSEGGLFEAEKTFSAIADNGTIYSHQLWFFGPPTYASATDSFAGSVKLGLSTIYPEPGFAFGDLEFIVTRASNAGYVGYSQPATGAPDIRYPLVNGVETDYTPVDITNSGLVVGHNGDDLYDTVQLSKVVWDDGTNIREFDTNEAPLAINEDKDILSSASIWELDPNQTNVHLRHSLNDRISEDWEILSAKDENDGGLIVAWAKRVKDSAGNPIAPESQVGKPVMLVPYEVVREKVKGSGEFVVLQDLPLFTPDNGVNRGPAIISANGSARITLTNNLSSGAVDTIQASFLNSTGAFDGLLTETTANSGVFVDSGSTFSLTINSPSTTSDSAVETLSVQVTNATMGYTNAAFTMLEDSKAERSYAPANFFAVIRLISTLSTSRVDTIDVQLTTESAAGIFIDETLTETTASSGVFVSPAGDYTVTVVSSPTLSPSTVETLQVDIADTFLTGGSATYTLSESTATSKVFSNFTKTPTTLPPLDPTVDDAGVFYLRLKGLGGATSLPVNVGMGGNEVEVTATTDVTDSTSLITSKLLIVPPSISASFSGLTVLPQATETSKLAFSLFGSPTIASTNVVKLSAFLGKDMEPSGVPAGHMEKVQSILSRELGFARTILDNSLEKEEFLREIPNHSVFYLFVHGRGDRDDGINPTFEGFVLPEEDSHKRELVNPLEIGVARKDNKRIDLVVINGCSSVGQPTAGEYIKNFNTKAYVGWQYLMSGPSAATATARFFEQLDGGATVEEAIQDISAIRKAGFVGSGTDMGAVDIFPLGDTKVKIDHDRTTIPN